MEAVLCFEEEINGKESDTAAETEFGNEEQSTLINEYSPNEEELYEQSVLKVEEAYREIYRQARFYPDELKQEIFEPSQPWNKWQETKDYKIEVSQYC